MKFFNKSKSVKIQMIMLIMIILQFLMSITYDLNLSAQIIDSVDDTSTENIIDNNLGEEGEEDYNNLSNPEQELGEFSRSGLSSGNYFYNAGNYQVDGGTYKDYSSDKYYVLKGTPVREIVGGTMSSNAVYSTNPEIPINTGELCPYLKVKSKTGNEESINSNRENCNYLLDYAPDFLKENENIVELRLDYVKTTDASGSLIPRDEYFNSVGKYKVYYQLVLVAEDGSTTYTSIKDYLTVEVLDEVQFMSVNDISISENEVISNEENLIKEISPEMVEVENIVDSSNVNHVGEVLKNRELFNIVDTGGYNYANPIPGNYTITIEGTSPNTGLTTTRNCNLKVVSSNEQINNGELLLSSPIKVDSGKSIKDVFTKANPITAFYENSNFNQAIKESMSNISILSNDSKLSSNENVDFYLLEVNYNDQGYEKILEVEKNSVSEDEVVISSINPIKVLEGSYFDPIYSTNTHAYYKDGTELPVTVLSNNVDINNPGSNGQILVEANYGDYEAYDIIEVGVEENIPGEVPIMLASDSEIENTSTIKSADELIELFNVIGIDLGGNNTGDLVEVYSTGGFQYGQPISAGDKYNVVMGYTSPVTGITMNIQTTLYGVNQGELETLELNGNTPVQVEQNDGNTSKDVSKIINPQLVVYLNYEVKEVQTSGISLVYDSAYNNSATGTYYFIYQGAYTSDLSGNTLQSSNIFQVNVKEDNIDSNLKIAINAPSNISIEQNTSFDPIATPNVTAYSSVDGDITSDIVVVTNEVNTSKVGSYPVSYYVSDSSKNSTSKYTMVNVYKEGENPIQGPDMDSLDNNNGYELGERLSDTSGTGYSYNDSRNPTHMNSTLEGEEELVYTSVTNLMDLIKFNSLIVILMYTYNKKYIK